MPAVIPAKTAGSLGEALTDIRTPVANELSAVHVERIKSLLIEIATEIGATASPAAGTILAKLAPSAPVIDTAETRTIANSDHGKTIWCFGALMDATVPPGLDLGTTVAFRVGEGCSRVKILAATGVALRMPDGLIAESFGGDSLVVVTVMGDAGGAFSDEVAQVDGDLAEAP